MCKFCPSHSTADYRVTWLVHHPLSQQLTSAYGARIFHVGWNASKSYFALDTFQRLVCQNCCIPWKYLSVSLATFQFIWFLMMANSLVLLWNDIFQTACQGNVEAWNAPPTQNHLELANVVLHFCWCSQWCVGWVLRWSLPICGRLSQGSVHSCSHMLYRCWVWATLKLNRHSTIPMHV